MPSIWQLLVAINLALVELNNLRKTRNIPHSDSLKTSRSKVNDWNKMGFKTNEGRYKDLLQETNDMFKEFKRIREEIRNFKKIQVNTAGPDTIKPTVASVQEKLKAIHADLDSVPDTQAAAAGKDAFPWLFKENWTERLYGKHGAKNK